MAVITKRYVEHAVDVSELCRLADLLTDNGIPFDWIDQSAIGGAEIKVPSMKMWSARRGVSIIQHIMSYGGQSGKLECWCSTKRMRDKEPVGWLSAEEALAKVKEALGDA